MTSEATCPVCRSIRTRIHLDDEEQAFDPSLFGASRSRITHGRILRCMDCEFGFRDLRSNPDEMAELYGQMDVGIYESEMAARKATAVRRLAVLNRFTTRRGRILDAGCASGLFLSAARQAGWEVTGVEPSQTLYSKALQTLGKDAEIYPCVLEKADFAPASFDAITLWDVFEHVSDPVCFMRLCASLLKPGGRLLVSVPDLDSVQARLLGKRWPMLLAEHFNYFNHKSLRLCGEMAGLKWVHFGKLRVLYSLEYTFQRAAQHGIPGASLARALSRPFIGKMLIPIHIGDTLGVWSR